MAIEELEEAIADVLQEEAEYIQDAQDEARYDVMESAYGHVQREEAE